MGSPERTSQAGTDNKVEKKKNMKQADVAALLPAVAGRSVWKKLSCVRLLSALRGSSRSVVFVKFWLPKLAYMIDAQIAT